MSPHDQQCWKTVPLSNYCVTSHKFLSKYFINNLNQDSGFVFCDETRTAASCLLRGGFVCFFKTDRPTVIEYDDHEYIFEGFSMFAHAPLTNVSMVIATYFRFHSRDFFRRCSFCPEAKLLRKNNMCMLQTSCQHWGLGKDICANESQVLS